MLTTEVWDLGDSKTLQLADLEVVISKRADDLWDAHQERLDPERQQFEAFKNKLVLFALQQPKCFKLDILVLSFPSRRATFILVAVDLCRDYQPFVA
ncbi:unnamed protein product [Phytophthora fragariaefolia]|uniref:Unnamed protein product n=1 Tax=Phytophthora fragariaefolia TaxID=1490495 RepID=A0A9W6TUN7_9STRA|nr:unnamed protein product [Phytophthora fragariaefolia]